MMDYDSFIQNIVNEKKKFKIIDIDECIKHDKPQLKRSSRARDIGYSEPSSMFSYKFYHFDGDNIYFEGKHDHSFDNNSLKERLVEWFVNKNGINYTITHVYGNSNEIKDWKDFITQIIE